MAHPLLEKAANLVEQARTLNDEFEDKSRMPAEVGHKIDELLTAADGLKKQVEREGRMGDLDSFLTAPERKGVNPLGVPTRTVESKEAKAERAEHAFWTFVKKGFSGMSPETKSSLVEDANGMTLVPHEFAGTILTTYARDAIMRPLVFVRPCSMNKVDVGSLVIAGGGWNKLDTTTTQNDALGSPATPGTTPQTIEVFDILALAKLGRDELEDAPDDLAAIIAPQVAAFFAQFEDDAIAAGTGTGQPVGLVTSTAITQKVDAATTTTVVSDDIIKLQYQLPIWALRNANFVGSGAAEQAVSLLKDSTGNYMWQYSVQAGTPSKLRGFNWYRHDGLPAPGAAGAKAKAIFFGDFHQGYMLADRRAISMQRLEERFADEGKIGLLFTKRVGGDVIRPKALAYYNV